MANRGVGPTERRRDWAKPKIRSTARGGGHLLFTSPFSMASIVFFLFFFLEVFFSKFFGSCPMPMADDLIIVRPFPFFCVIFFPFQSRNRSRTRKNRKKRTKKSHFQRGKQNTVTSTPIPVTAKEQWSNCIWQHQPEPLPANPKFACAIFDDHFDDNNNNNNSVKTLDQLVVRPFIEEKELH